MREQIHVRVEPETRLGLRALAAVGHVSAGTLAAGMLDDAVRKRLDRNELARLVLANLRRAEQETAS